MFLKDPFLTVEPSGQNVRHVSWGQFRDRNKALWIFEKRLQLNKHIVWTCRLHDQDGTIYKQQVPSTRPAKNHGSYIRQNKNPVQDNGYSYRDSLQVRLMEIVDHYRKVINQLLLRNAGKFSYYWYLWQICIIVSLNFFFRLVNEELY